MKRPESHKKEDPSFCEWIATGGPAVKESWTYKAIVAVGRAEGAVDELKKILREAGEEAFGRPPARIAAVLERMEDLATFEECLKRLRTANSWQELLGQVLPSPQRGRRRST